MLDKELRHKLQPLRDDLARASDPDYDTKTPVTRLSKELNRSIQWVIQNSGNNISEIHAAYRLSRAEESKVRAIHEVETAVRTKPRESAPEISKTLKSLALEMVVPYADVVDEVVRRGASRKRAKARMLLSAKEAALLQKYFAERSRSRRKKPASYRPSPTGRVSFEAYERISAPLLEELIGAGFLPTRAALARQPEAEWPQVISHFRHQRDLQILVQGRRNVPAASPVTASNAPQRIAQPNTIPAAKAPTSSIPSRHREGIRTSTKMVLTVEARSRLQSNPTDSPSQSPNKTRPRSATNTALIPPKPASVAQLQSRKAVGLIKKEVEGGQLTGVPPEPAFRTFRTTVSAGSTAVADLQESLREFHPRMYATFFDQLRDVLEVDRLVARTMRTATGFSATDPEHVRIINDVCEYSYGIFAYWEMGSKIGRKARSIPIPSAKKVKTALMNLRPMYKGVLTDLCHGRFVFWRVGKIWDLVEVRFDDVHDWLDGLADGEYVPLTTHHIPLGDSKNLVAPMGLSNRDQDIVKFMSEAAQNLRQGVHGVRGRKATNGPSGLEPRRAGTLASSGARTLGYRPENTWLVPITITDGQVDTTLDEDFFSGFDDKKPHQVRSFYRRPKGSSPNAPRTEFVNGHVRGGRGAFADMKLLPVVTIRRR